MDPIERGALTRRRFMTLAGAGLGGAGLAWLAACGGDDGGAPAATTPDPTTAGTSASAPATSTGASAAPATTAVAATDAAPVERAAVVSQLSWVPNVEYAGYWIGLEDGFFTAEGIELTPLTGGPNAPDSSTMVAAGQADVGHSSDFIGLVDAVLAGNDFVFFAVKLQTSPLGFIWLPDAGVSEIGDLLGKRIGAPQGNQPFIDATFRINGIEPDYSFVPMGFDPQPLVDGEIDAMTCFVTNQPLTLKVQGIDVEAATLADWGLAQYADAMFAQRSYVEEHRDRLVRYLRATIKGWEVNATDPERAAHLVIDKYGQDLGLDLHQQILNNEAQLPLMESPLTQDKGLLRISKQVMTEQMYPTLEAIGRTGLPDVDRLVDESILDEVYGGRNRLT